MNTLVVYFSKFGNTRNVAAEIASQIRDVLPVPATVRLLAAEELTPEILPENNLVVLGSPTHNMNLPRVVRPMLDNLPPHCLRGKYIATFDTSYKLSWYLRPFTAAPRLHRICRRLGGKPLVRPETFHVTEREGPLYDGELERSTHWARMVVERFVAQNPAKYQPLPA